MKKLALLFVTSVMLSGVAFADGKCCKGKSAKCSKESSCCKDKKNCKKECSKEAAAEKETKSAEKKS
jgi:hypothetical protein